MNRFGRSQAQAAGPRAVDPLDAILARDLPPDSGERLDAYERMTVQQRATYVSTPITTGRRLLTWLGGEGGAKRRAGEVGLTEAAVRDEVMQHNVRAVATLVKKVRHEFPETPVIDPTKLAVDGWSQLDYHRFWIEVIRNCVSTLVFADEWYLSTGCTIEYLMAQRMNLPCMDSKLCPISPDDARYRLTHSADEYVRANHPNNVLEAAADWLQACEATT